MVSFRFYEDELALWRKAAARYQRGNLTATIRDAMAEWCKYGPYA
jgi:hypothetical protein